MTELSPDLKAFYEPWTVRNITPSVAGRPQPFFFHRDARITRILTGRFHIAAMRRAIALARQLMFSKVGRNIAGSALSEAQTRLAANDPLPAPVHGLRSVPDHLMQRIDEISSREEWTYVIILQAPGNLLGQVHRDRPREICLSFPAINACANAILENEMDADVIPAQTVEQHIFFLAGVIVHEMMHSLRYIILGSFHPTPPQLRGYRSRDDLEPWTDESGSTWIRGEGGFHMEPLLFGGHLLLCHAMVATYHPEKPTELIVARRLPGRPISDYFLISSLQVQQIVNRIPGWEALLPLRPADRWVRGVPANISFRISDHDSEDADDLMAITCGTGKQDFVY